MRMTLMEFTNCGDIVQAMAITRKSIKILWSAAGGRCAFPNCWERLCYHEAKNAAPYTLGEMAHICGDKPGSNRHDLSLTESERDNYQNLILLCPTHHTVIDRKENETIYTVEMLLEMKAAHEATILERLDKRLDVGKEDIAREILPLLEESRQSWAQYGPTSELARTQPYNEAVHAVWEAERLSVIVPNNRKIAELLLSNKKLFDASEHAAVLAFLMHERSYDQWVNDAIPYSAVKRFPAEFDELIRGIADAGI